MAFILGSSACNCPALLLESGACIGSHSVPEQLTQIAHVIAKLPAPPAFVRLLMWEYALDGLWAGQVQGMGLAQYDLLSGGT